MKHRTYSIAVSAIAGAAYALLTVLLAPISYGAIQFRISEVLCILPCFIPSTVWGITAGCLIANLFTGNVFDMIFGTLATLIACVMVAYFGKRYGRSVKSGVFSCLAVVLINAVVVGAVITRAYNGMNILEHPEIFLINAGQVALGEAAVMFAAGFPLMRYLPRNRVFNEYVSKFNGTEK